MKNFKYLFSVLFFSIGLIFAPITISQDKRSYILATASTGGTFYPVGVAVSTLTKVKLEPQNNISMSAITSAGSGDNIKLLKNNEAQFAILQGLYGAWAWKGEGAMSKLGPQKHFRSISMLWQNVEHFLVKSSSVKGDSVLSMSELKNKRFSIGKKNSGTEGSGKYILSKLNVDADKMKLVHMGYGASAGALQDGRIDGMNTPAGAPVSAVTQAFSSMGNTIKVLDFTQSELDLVNKDYPLWSRHVIPAETYPGQKKPINTISQPNFLAVRADLSEDDVYLITKTIYENLSFLKSIHKATGTMDVKKAIAGLSVPLHPGATKYYREVGIDIPEYLIQK